MNDLVKNINGKIVVSSKDVSDVFKKRHDNVIRDIESLYCDDEFRRLNYEESFYTSKQNKELPCFNMSRDGFCFLVMGFKGKDAARWKIAYIRAFNEMEEALRESVSVMDECNKALKSMGYDEEKASESGRGLAKWRKQKAAHIENIKRLESAAQISLGFY